MRRPSSAIDPADLASDWQADAAARSAADAIQLDGQLVTPLYGGGVVAGEVDRRLPIRIAGLRGQWRFWWRLLRQRNQPDPRALFLEETAIWGGLGQNGDQNGSERGADSGPTASRVAVRLLHCGQPALEAAHEYARNPKAPGEWKAQPDLTPWASGYALFPAQGKRAEDRRSVEEQPKRLALPGIEFRLLVRFHPELPDCARDEVHQAIRWWASFGGIGARTRRGLGAVQVATLAPVTVAEVQALGGQLALLRPGRNATDAWKAAVALLQLFRQGVGVGRNPGDEPNRPGRSRWPEADTLRALSGRAAAKHQTPVCTVRAFPRAAFGLPIVFHFKDKGDPDDHILEPADLHADLPRDRLASPLILRPYWDGTGWHPAALLLPGWQTALRAPLKFKADHQQDVPTPWPADPPSARAALANDVKPMQGRGDDVLTAFMDFFAKGGH